MVSAACFTAEQTGNSLKRGSFDSPSPASIISNEITFLEVNDGFPEKFRETTS